MSDSDSQDDSLRLMLDDADLELIDLLGEGGMGRVYKVHNPRLERLEALKVIDRRHLYQVEYLRRLQQEAKSIGCLQHDGIVQVYGMGVLADGVPYLSMEALEGQSLSTFLLRHGRLSATQFTGLFKPLLAALGYAHQQGVLHRDLKPSNIFLGGGKLETPKLIDFGLAQQLNKNDILRITQTGEMLGTPTYMSPEHCRGEILDERSDIYSLGCIMYECLYGNPPYSGDNALDVMVKHSNGDTPALPVLPGNQTVPPHVQALLIACLSKDKNVRPRSAQAVLSMLEDDSARPAPKTGKKIAASARLSARQALVVVGAAALLAAAAVGAAIVSQPSSTAPPLPAATKDEVDRIYIRSQGAIKNGDFSEAVSLLSSIEPVAIKFSPSLYADVCAELGACHRQLEHEEQSLLYLRKGLQATPERRPDFIPEATEALLRETALTYDHFRHQPQARTYFKQSADFLQAWKNNGRPDFRADRWGDQSSQTFYYWGLFEERANNLSEAERLFKLVLAADARPLSRKLLTRRLDTMFHLAGILHRQHQVAEALDLYLQLAALEGTDVVALSAEELAMREEAKALAAQCSQELKAEKN